MKTIEDAQRSVEALERQLKESPDDRAIRINLAAMRKVLRKLESGEGL